MSGLATGVAMEERTHCPRGHEYTPENTRHRKGKRPGLTCRVCIECERTRRREAQRAKAAADPLYHRRAWLMRTYGITVERYIEILDAQGGVCAGCSKPCSVKAFLSVDHEHETGEIRGLLCHHCNLAVGYAKDDPELLEALAAYLRAGVPCA